jgi:hypothetical protein
MNNKPPALPANENFIVLRANKQILLYFNNGFPPAVPFSETASRTPGESFPALRFAPLIRLSDAGVPDPLDQDRCVGFKLSRLGYSFRLRGRDGTRPFRFGSTNGKVTLGPALDKEVFVAHLLSFLFRSITQLFALTKFNPAASRAV